MTGAVRETYHAAIQHDMLDLDGDERLVGVVRRPTPWFSGAVEENRSALGPPADLLDEVKAAAEDMKLRGICDEEAHNAAWPETDFERRYLEYLERSPEAQSELDDLAADVRAGETVVLVCYEGNDKRCHRRLLVDALRERVESAGAEDAGDGGAADG